MHILCTLTWVFPSHMTCMITSHYELNSILTIDIKLDVMLACQEAVSNLNTKLTGGGGGSFLFTRSEASLFAHHLAGNPVAFSVSVYT